MEQLRHSGIISSWGGEIPFQVSPQVVSSRVRVTFKNERGAAALFCGVFFFVKTHHQKRIICPLDVAFKRNQLKVLQLCKVKFHIQPQRQNITRTSKQTGISSCASSAIYTGRVTGRRARAHAHTHAPTHYCFDFLPPCHTKWWMHSNCSG